MMKFRRITVDPAVCTGKPCIRGLRFPVSRLLGLLAAGETKEKASCKHILIWKQRTLIRPFFLRLFWPMTKRWSLCPQVSQTSFAGINALVGVRAVEVKRGY